MAEILLLLAVIAVPLAIGTLTAYLARPWWWGALLATTLAFVAAIEPEPEAGESRVAAGDLVFLLIVALFVSGLTLLGALTARRLRGTQA